MQKIVPILMFCFALVCFAMYFNLKAPPPQETLPETAFKLETLQLDTSTLGTISPLNDGCMAGNTRGELRIFPRFEPNAEPVIHQVSTYSISAPVLEKDGNFYVGDENGRFWAFNPDNGVKWFYRTRNQITGRAIWCDELVLVGSHSQSLFAFEPETGELKYTVECDGEINGTPVFIEPSKALVFGSCDGLLRKIDVRTGEILGEIDFESMIPDTPSIRDGILYILTNDGILAAIDSETFKLIYRVSTGEQFLSSPYATEKFIFVTDFHGKISVHSRKDGAKLATLEADDKMTTLQAGDDTAVFAVSRRGKLYQWRHEGDHWIPTVLTDSQTDYRRGCVLFGDKLLLPDESGGLFYVNVN